MNKLTVIIPFLNEGDEVKNTVENVLDTSGGNIDIIIINDASTDGINYRSVAEYYGIEYIEHKFRKGVAASRDEGVMRCRTDYLILLDAHMRFYQNDWVDIICSELDRDQRQLLCCQSKILNMDENGTIFEKNRISMVYGAYINFTDKRPLSVSWNHHLDPAQLSESIVDVPAVLGASYAISKKYWEYLKGLNGLRSYGFDETLISLKVWLEGGCCRLIKNISTGHIYRKKMPYSPMSVDYVFNIMFIAELFCDYSLKYRIYKELEKRYPIVFDTALKELLNETTNVENQKKYYASIFTNNLKEIEFVNNRLRYLNKYGFLSDRDKSTSDSIVEC